MRSISSFERAVPPVIVIACSLPVARSLAVTFTIPLASLSKESSICGTPRGAADRHDLTGVDALVRLLPSRDLLRGLRNHRHARGSTHEHDVVDRGDVLAPVLHRHVERDLAPLDEVLGHALELGPGELLLE